MGIIAYYAIAKCGKALTHIASKDANQCALLSLWKSSCERTLYFCHVKVRSIASIVFTRMTLRPHSVFYPMRTYCRRARFKKQSTRQHGGDYGSLRQKIMDNRVDSMVPPPLSPDPSSTAEQRTSDNDNSDATHHENNEGDDTEAEMMDEFELTPAMLVQLFQQLCDHCKRMAPYNDAYVIV